MVVLKKIKSATLVEAIVATVLIVIVFVVASLILNNLLLNTFSKNTHQIENHLNELEYEIQNGHLKFPYQENYKDWNIQINKEKTESLETLIILATKEKSQKKISRHLIYE
ncbi:hypothetical protein SAMN04488062_1314 [Flavobacterium omnivorum]|uniref:Prepilin-type N-terminal cleavage/methylation domain-containing protein n=1 Tax=Flavobacterium omnivorum TaxID=178355 RepID=A0A1G8J1E8_9FLAO|nr:hypothetical protein [Flavobacterium omnivorum]SDI24882.1 hypothetical protein SAMN04488062_1314 [Flavobacterium omnivorum]